MGMNGLVGRRRREHQALPGPRGCSAWASKVLSSLQKRGRRCAATSTVTPAWRAYRSPQAAQRQGPTAPARALTFTHRAGTTHLTQGSRDSETQRLAQNHQPGSREAAQVTAWLTHGTSPGAHAGPHPLPHSRGTPGPGRWAWVSRLPHLCGAEPRHCSAQSSGGTGKGLDFRAGLVSDHPLEPEGTAGRCLRVLRRRQLAALAFPKPPSHPAPRAPRQCHVCGNKLLRVALGDALNPTPRLTHTHCSASPSFPPSSPPSPPHLSH